MDNSTVLAQDVAVIIDDIAFDGLVFVKKQGVITAANKVLTFRAVGRVQSNGTGDFSNLLFGQIAQR